MMPTEILEEEHEIILKVIEVLRAISYEMESADPADLEGVIDFIRTFADKCHHAKEEKILFVEAEKYGVPKEGGPIGMMLYEHDQGRGYVKGMDEALKKIKSGDKKALKAFRESMLGYADLLDPHIKKENQILYPMINMHIPANLQKDIMKKFDEVEKEEVGEGVHHKFHEFVHELEAKYLGKEVTKT